MEDSYRAYYNLNNDPMVRTHMHPHLLHAREVVSHNTLATTTITHHTPSLILLSLSLSLSLPLYTCMYHSQQAFFGVYDGHGGDKTAAFVANKLHLTVEKMVKNTDNVNEALRNAYLDVDRRWLEMAEVNKWNDGTTATGALIRDGTIYVANVGDSRAIMVSREPNGDGRVVRELSKDHKPSRPDEKRRIKEAGGSVIFWGVWYVK
jgi:Protein phosphatase 2C